MAFKNPVQLIGATASPYTQKMIALLRYRLIPYAVTWGEPAAICAEQGVAPPTPVLLPTFIEEDDGVRTAVCDSTPIIRRLEQEHPARSVLPDDPALGFIDYLIEDFADEWCTKYMFHYRWHFEADADNAGTLLPLAMNTVRSEEDLETFKTQFAARQRGRLFVVGSSDITAPVIDASYRRFLAAMNDHLSRQHFMLGKRPGACDFALHGQLSQLVGFDPTPRAITHELSPRTVAWVDRVYDLSGLMPVDSDWVRLEEQPSSLKALLKEIGRVYAPAQLANADAVKAGKREWHCEIDGAPWTQRTFAYQAKCLQWTNERYQALSHGDRVRVDSFLDGSGVETMLSLH